MSLRLATQGCIRKVTVVVSSWRSSLGGFGWFRNMADSGKATAGAQEAGQPVVKTEKQLKKEAQKNAKLAKYNEKMAKQKAQNAGEVKKQKQTASPTTPLPNVPPQQGKPKEKKAAGGKKAPSAFTYDIPTPPGEKKGEFCCGE